MLGINMGMKVIAARKVCVLAALALLCGCAAAPPAPGNVSADADAGAVAKSQAQAPQFGYTVGDSAPGLSKDQAEAAQAKYLADRTTSIGLDRPMRAVVAPLPTYTQVARAAGIEGVVRAQLHIATDGTVKSVSIAPESAPKELIAIVRDALSQWRFEPALRAGRAVEIVARQEFVFRLSD